MEAIAETLVRVTRVWLGLTNLPKFLFHYLEKNR